MTRRDNALCRFIDTGPGATANVEQIESCIRTRSNDVGVREVAFPCCNPSHKKFLLLSSVGFFTQPLMESPTLMDKFWKIHVSKTCVEISTGSSDTPNPSALMRILFEREEEGQEPVLSCKAQGGQVRTESR